MRRAALSLLLAPALAACAGASRPPSAAQIPVSGKVTLTGEVHRPAGDGAFPALVLLHRCSGIVPGQLAWAHWIPDARRGAGATVAYNPASHADAEPQVEQFLATHMKP